MPKLPTIRVMGSQATSTRPSAFSLSLLGLAMVVVMGACLLAVLGLRCLPGASRARGELGTRLTPLGFLVDRVLSHRTEATQGRTPGTDHGRGELAARGLVHERHELVRKAWHCAADADTAHVRATSDPIDPTALGHVALDHRAPAA